MEDDLTDNPDTQSTIPGDKTLADIATLMDLYRSGGELSHDDLLTLYEAISGEDVALAVSATDTDRKEIRQRLDAA
jgi:hypothetical protein